ncbi:MAG TPA: MerR family transcriptional regulator [Clostridiales bacterium]|jgi:DNA-binding transcriptional MerR regulator|nr:MerR family transcriptional regulator [Clostridiales bacterium]
MENPKYTRYTIKKMAEISGVSTRTLRYYDELGLLKPESINESGYRLYGQKQVDILQQILFYRELGMKLADIKKILSDPGFDIIDALNHHRDRLLKERQRLNKLISNVEKTLLNKKGAIEMSDKEKFEGFKQNMIDENEKKYGKEIREKYGDEAVEQSNRKIKSMTKQEFDEAEKLNEKLIETLLEAYKTGDSKGELAWQAADLHRQWLTHYWGSYSKEAHAGLARMYVDDSRFTEYYDKFQPGLTVFLRDAILNYTNQD